MSYISIVSEIFILVIYIFIGYIARKIKLITESGIRDISKLMVNITIPFLLLNAMNIEYKAEYVQNMLCMALLAFIYVVLTTFVSKYIARRFTNDGREYKAMRYCLIFGNLAFLGYPICYALFGQIGVFYASIYVIVQNTFQWTIGVNIYKQQKISLSNLKNLINPGIAAIFIGLFLFFFDIRLPEIIVRVIKEVGSITIPLGLMMTGALLYGYSFLNIAADRRIQATAIFKVLIFPLAYLAMIYFLPIDNMIKSIMTVQVAGPIQATSTVFARNFNGDTEIPAKAVFFSTLLCLITIPLFLVLINM